jgi:hypothetical protein
MIIKTYPLLNRTPSKTNLIQHINSLLSNQLSRKFMESLRNLKMVLTLITTLQREANKHKINKDFRETFINSALIKKMMIF